MARNYRVRPIAPVETIVGSGLGNTEAGETSVTFSDCRGWLHQGAGDTGIIICPDIGRDAHVSYTTLRRLAVELAQAGYPTLRFDYPGTGDSIDVPTVDPVIGWLRGIDDAIIFLRETGVRRIVLCGYRVGALFSLMKSADHEDVDEIVMIDPIMSGAAFLRQVSIAASVGAQLPDVQHPTLEIDGTVLVDGPASTLYTMDASLLQSRPAKRLLMLTSSSSRNSDRFAHRARELGMKVTQAEFEPIREFSGDGYVGRTVSLDAIRSWLGPATKITDVPRSDLHIETTLDGQDFVESPLSFGGRLFGMLCQPIAETKPDRVVLIGSCGLSPRYGPSRFHVYLARQLAAAGIASLRFDFAGLGDSSHAAADDTHIYETNRSSDVSAAIDALEASGHRDFVTAGVCSGGYHAWLASLDDDRISAVLMVNPAVFTWRQGQSLEALVHTGSRSARSYLALMSQGNRWQFLSQFGVRRAIRTTRVVATRYLSATVRRGTRLIRLPVKSNFPLKAMRRLSRRGARVLVIMAADDAGRDSLSAHFGRNGRLLAKLPGSAVHIMSDIDHAVTRRVMQVQVTDVLLKFLSAQAGLSGVPASFSRKRTPAPAIVLEENYI